MAFEKLSDIISYRKGALEAVRPRTNQADIVVSTDISGRTKDGALRYGFKLSISAKCARKAKILSGDRIELYFDRDVQPIKCFIKRVREGGWAIISVNKNNPNTRLFVKVNCSRGVPTFAQPTGCKAQITEEGILFNLPSEHSFSENLRVPLINVEDENDRKGIKGDA